nr:MULTISPECIES: hypothetical protein [Rhodococcus]
MRGDDNRNTAVEPQVGVLDVDDIWVVVFDRAAEQLLDTSHLEDGKSVEK